MCTHCVEGALEDDKAEDVVLYRQVRELSKGLEECKKENTLLKEHITELEYTVSQLRSDLQSLEYGLQYAESR